RSRTRSRLATVSDRTPALRRPPRANGLGAGERLPSSTMKTRGVIGATAGAAAFAAAGILGGAPPLTLARLVVLGAAAAVAALYDITQRRIPNRVVLPSSACCAGLALGAGITPLALSI